MFFHGNPDKFESRTENSRNSICSFSKLIYCRDLCHWEFVEAEIGRKDSREGEEGKDGRGREIGGERKELLLDNGEKCELKR